MEGSDATRASLRLVHRIRPSCVSPKKDSTSGPVQAPSRWASDRTGLNKFSGASGFLSPVNHASFQILIESESAVMAESLSCPEGPSEEQSGGGETHATVPRNCTRQKGRSCCVYGLAPVLARFVPFHVQLIPEKILFCLWTHFTNLFGVCTLCV